MSAICEPCQNDEHFECSEPIATRAEVDTGYQHVLICCDGEFDVPASQSEAAIERAIDRREL